MEDRVHSTPRMMQSTLLQETTPLQEEELSEKKEAHDHLMQPLISDAKGSSGLDLEPSRTRSVSWEEVPALGDMGHRQVPSRISLRQVMDHSPYESLADAYIQLALDEEADVTPEGLSEAQKTILGNVPLNVPIQSFKVDSATPATQASTPAPATRRSSLPLHENTARRKRLKRSTAESLYDLSDCLERLNPTSDNASGASLPSDDISLERNSLLGNASIIMAKQISLYRMHTGGLKEEPKAYSNQAPLSNEAGLTMTSPSKCGKESKSPDSNEGELDPEMEIVFVADSRATVEGGGEKRNADGGEKSMNDDNSERSSASLVPVNDDNRERSSFSLVGKQRAVTEFKDFEDWLRVQRSSAWTHIKVVLFLIMVPSALISAILFYAVGNPPCSQHVCTPLEFNEYNTTYPEDPYYLVTIQKSTFGLAHEASASWWVLFIGCRQAITFTLARGTNSLVIDYWALQSRWCVKIFGPFVTLFIVQSRGWPFILFFWGVYDFILLYGDSNFARHWLFYQQVIDMFNASNPSGAIPGTSQYLTVLMVALIVTFLVAIKRFYFGLVQGRRSYIRYSEELAVIMKRTLIISQVARLSRKIETSKLRFENFDFKAATRHDYAEFEETHTRDTLPSQEFSGRHLLSGVDIGAKKARLVELLGAWEEPEAKSEADENPDVAAVLQFRHGLSYLRSSINFGPSFGPSSTREECVESAEVVYNRLLQSTPGRQVLIFDVLATLASSTKGGLDEEVLLDMIKLFRPDRDGLLTLLDFAKSIDTVYKEIRLLRASVTNSSKLDRAAENIFNIFFYIFIFLLCLAMFGVRVYLLLAAVSGFLLSVAFMIGIACSNFIEGLLLILVRRPYDIGDRIHISDPNTDTLSTGSPGWIVKDIDLFTTTVVLQMTNEVATYSNGALAASRIINGARSLKAATNFLLKFPIDAPYTKLQIFKSAIERFVKARPREWGAFVAFRCTRVEADLGYVEYIVISQHRESWQKIGAVLQSRAELSSFALELSKQMDIRYISPPMPVDLTVKQGEIHGVGAAEEPIREDVRQSVGTDSTSMDHVAHDVAAMFGTDLSP